VLVAGGGNGGAQAAAELYDRTAGTWRYTGGMNAARTLFPAVLLSDGSVLVAGGDTPVGPTNACDRYHWPSGLWFSTGNMTTEREYHTGTLLKTGKVLVTGGIDLGSNGLATAELYDPGLVSLIKVVSSKVHGSVGTFEINLPLTGSPGIECRSGGTSGDYTMVFIFGTNLTSVDSAEVSNGTGMITSSMIDSNDPHKYIVNLTGVTNAQYITVTLIGLSDAQGDFSSSLEAMMGVLVGDVNASRRVDAADVSAVRQQTLQNMTNSNFRNDINASGRIDAADVSIARQQTLTALP
jgi:hypothetical protein